MTSLDHAAQVPTVLSTRELEGASVSVHRLPVAAQRQVRTVQTVQVSEIPPQCSFWMRLLSCPSL